MECERAVIARVAPDEKSQKPDEYKYLSKKLTVGQNRFITESADTVDTALDRKSVLRGTRCESTKAGKQRSIFFVSLIKFT